MANTARFVSDNGNVYEFGTKGQTAFTMNFGDGVSVEIGTMQGFSQIGETVQNKTVIGRYIDVKGFIYKNIEENKKKMRKTFAPLQSGKLFINEKYYIRVFVKDSPSFSIMKKNGSFMMQLYAPYPFFKKVDKKNYSIENIVPKFSFPINYSEPHEFGTVDKKKWILVSNDGDAPALYHCKVYVKENVDEIIVSNITNGEFLGINIPMKSGDILDLFRDENNVFCARLATSTGVLDLIGFINDKSNFFEIPVGESVVSVLASYDKDISAQISFEESVVSVFED